MKHLLSRKLVKILLVISFLFNYHTILADDTCVFMVTADDIPPNITILLDNGVEMKQVIPHPAYDSSVDYTPSVATPIDIVPNGASGNGFFNENGYGIYETANKYYLTPVGADMQLNTAVRLEGLVAAVPKTSTWTINGKTITLPAEASSTTDGNGIIDNAGAFRYSKNYLNWLFFSGNYAGDGSDLPDKSRFYYAKKALLTVGKLTSNKAKFAIYNFANDEGSSPVQPLDDVVAALGATPEENTLRTDYTNNINNMGTVIYSPLAEGMATIGKDIDSPAFGAVDSTNYCQKTFVIVVSPGLSSQDIASGCEEKQDENGDMVLMCDLNDSLALPGDLRDQDEDGKDGFGNNGPGEGSITLDGQNHEIVTNYNGSTYMDDVAHYFYTNDMRGDPQPDATEAVQIVSTYTVGFMATTASRLLLINTSNNGNGKTNLTSSAHPDYGKYHFDAASAEGLSQAVLDAVNSIISRT
ncbi:MAG: hypothetical protein KAR15_09885, partial [Desulfobacterales bacterium]|nr:hypothetical protein [Desulfobacterales bacterium]